MSFERNQLRAIPVPPRSQFPVLPLAWGLEFKVQRAPADPFTLPQGRRSQAPTPDVGGWPPPGSQHSSSPQPTPAPRAWAEVGNQGTWTVLGNQGTWTMMVSPGGRSPGAGSCQLHTKLFLSMDSKTSTKAAAPPPPRLLQEAGSGFLSTSPSPDDTAQHLEALLP